MDKYQLQSYMEAEPGAKLKDLVSKLLYDEIVSLRILPGTRLNVNQLASSLGVSRTPVAEAVASLADIGCVVSRPGQSGSYVLDLDMVDMIHLYHVRNAIECEAASLCAVTAGENTVRELTMLAEAFKTSVEGRDIRGMRETDMPFHRLIVDASANPYLIRSYEAILPKLTMFQASMIEFVGQQGNESNPWLFSVKYNHVSVVSAIRLRQPELARQSMADHIRTSLNFTSLSGERSDPFHPLWKKER